MVYEGTLLKFSSPTPRLLHSHCVCSIVLPTSPGTLTELKHDASNLLYGGMSRSRPDEMDIVAVTLGTKTEKMRERF